MGKVFVIDIARCSGCYNCQIACKDEHCGNDWRPYAAPQPDTGQFWMHLDEHIRGTIPKVKMHYLPHLCNHCRNAPCIDACPEGALERRGDGLVLLLPDKCSGCKKCVDVCPYDAIFFNETLNIAQKCTGCAHLLDSGEALPRCAEACPTEAIKFGEEAELTDLIAKASVLKPECECDPRRLLPGHTGAVHRGHRLRPSRRGGYQKRRVRPDRRRQQHHCDDGRFRRFLVQGPGARRLRRRHQRQGLRGQAF